MGRLDVATRPLAAILRLPSTAAGRICSIAYTRRKTILTSYSGIGESIDGGDV